MTPGNKKSSQDPMVYPAMDYNFVSWNGPVMSPLVIIIRHYILDSEEDSKPDFCTSKVFIHMIPGAKVSP